ncbi:MAG: cytochrome c peroxidase [Desulfatiglandales bacterium]
MPRANSFLCASACIKVLLLVLPYFVLAGPLEPLKAPPIPKMNPQTPEKVELGKQLFFDRRLSGDGTMSCASCHIPELGFSDGQAISLSYPTTKNWRNAPTLINVVFSRYLFHDGRVESLEDQALFPMMSAFEMNQNLDFLEEELPSVPEYVKAFKKIFGTDDITRKRIGMALAAFERTLISGNAPIDRYLNGDEVALSPEAKKGLEIFTGKGKCADCHYGVNLIDDKFHALMVPENSKFQKDPRVAATRRFVAKLYNYKAYRTLAEDPGRYLITKDGKDWKAFKTPTLREIDKTAPYMHNGIFKTLDDVITFFDRGGGQSNTILKPIGLTAENL